MFYSLTIPSRINILGNPTDALEGEFAVISAAVEIRAGAYVEPAEAFVLDVVEPGIHDCTVTCRQVYALDDLPLPYTGELDLVKGAINRLHAFSPEFRRKLPEQGVRIATWTHVPRQSGLGGSSLFVLLALAGLREAYTLDRRVHNDYVLSELTQRVEDLELGITCGYADRYVPLFGGLAYVDYRGKLDHRPLGDEPYATYERLDPWIDDLPIVAVSTGVERDSGDVHGRLRPTYMEEHAAWLAHPGKMPPLVRFMSGTWEAAWRGKQALLAGDLATFGAMMNRNHALVNQMMAYCGFTDGAGQANNRMIEAALENGALGAKLTGAGSGGSVYALVEPGQEAVLEAAWRAAAGAAGLTEAQIFRPRIARQGLIVERHAAPLAGFHTGQV
ncbi:MAG: hypothetical protein JXB35_17520 [Anaerolineae bacterium]|nr:hypothetical protein [Anaerolineae bacterium]